MDAIDDTRTLGRARLDFASEHDIDEFVETLQKFERGEMPPDQWRRFRLVRGTYGQRQDGVQMLRVKAPQGIVSSSQMRAFAGVASRYSRGFCHITTRQNIQFHFVLLKNVEAAMRELADEGLTTREACGNSVRNVTGCPYAGTSDTEIFDPSPYAEAITRWPRSTISAGVRGLSMAAKGSGSRWPAERRFFRSPAISCTTFFPSSRC